MTANLPDNALELRSLVTSHGMLEVSRQEVPIPIPSANEVLVRVEASPINPSDLRLLLAGAGMTAAHVVGTPERPVMAGTSVGHIRSIGPAWSAGS
jgi:NADPH:quinone reductase